MAVQWYNTTGAPADSVGVAGDLALDTAGFIWGPKTTTWVGTARNITGATGPAGASALTPFTGAMQGPSVNIAGIGMLLNIPNVVSGSAYTPSKASYFLGGSWCVMQGTYTMELYDQTAGVSLYKSSSFSAGAVANFGPFPAAPAAYGGIPLTAGNTVVWRVAGGAGTASGNIEPIYYDTVQAPPWPFGVSSCGTYTAAAVQSTTAQTMRIPGATSYVKYFRPTKNSCLFRVSITNSGTSGYVTAYLATLGNSSGDGSVLCRNFDASGAVYQVPPNTTWTSPPYGFQFFLAAGTNYAWYTQGTSNGICTLTHQIYQ